MSLFKHCVKKFIDANISINQIRYYPRWSHRQPARVITPDKYEDEHLHAGTPKHSDKCEEIKWNNKKKNNYELKETHVVDLEELESRSNVSHNKKIRSAHTDKFKEINWKHKKNNSYELKKSQVIDLDEIDSKSGVLHPKKYKEKMNTPQLKKRTAVDMLETVIGADGEIIYIKMKDNDARVGSLFATVKSRKEKTKKDLILLEGKRLNKEALENGCKLQYLIFSRSNEINYLKPYLPKSGSKIFKMPYKEMQMWSDLSTSPGIMGLFTIPDLTTHTPKKSIPLTVICDNVRVPGNLGAILRACAGVGCEKIILTKGCADVWDSKVTRSAAGAHFKLQIHRKQDWADIRPLLKRNTNVYIADNNIANGNVETTNNNSEQDIMTLPHSLPVIPYFSVDFSKLNPIVLIVGGETEGISVQSYEFASEYSGVRLNIPLLNNVDSLNTGTALGIIMFEIKKQLYTDCPSIDREILVN